MYEVYGPPHLTEDGVPVLSGRGTIRVTEATFGGAEQQPGGAVQHQAGTLDLGPLAQRADLEGTGDNLEGGDTRGDGPLASRL